MPDIADHVQSAQNSGYPLRLTRTTSAIARQNRQQAIKGLTSAGANMSWDEYPFASSIQGGTFGGRTASIKAVPLIQNLVQGGIIGAAYVVEPINVGDSFWVVVIP